MNDKNVTSTSIAFCLAIKFGKGIFLNYCTCWASYYKRSFLIKGYRHQRQPCVPMEDPMEDPENQ